MANAGAGGNWHRHRLRCSSARRSKVPDPSPPANWSVPPNGHQVPPGSRQPAFPARSDCDAWCLSGGRAIGDCRSGARARCGQSGHGRRPGVRHDSRWDVRCAGDGDRRRRSVFARRRQVPAASAAPVRASARRSPCSRARRTRAASAARGTNPTGGTGNGGVGFGGDGGTIVAQHRGGGGGGRTTVRSRWLDRRDRRRRRRRWWPTSGAACRRRRRRGLHRASARARSPWARMAQPASIAARPRTAAPAARRPPAARAERTRPMRALNGAAGTGIGVGTGGNGGPDPDFDSGGGGAGGYTGGGGGASTISSSVTGGGGGGGSSWVSATSPLGTPHGPDRDLRQLPARHRRSRVGSGVDGLDLHRLAPMPLQIDGQQDRLVPDGHRRRGVDLDRHHHEHRTGRDDAAATRSTLTDLLPAGPNGGPGAVVRGACRSTSRAARTPSCLADRSPATRPLRRRVHAGIDDLLARLQRAGRAGGAVGRPPWPRPGRVDHDHLSADHRQYRAVRDAHEHGDRPRPRHDLGQRPMSSASRAPSPTAPRRTSSATTSRSRRSPARPGPCRPDPHLDRDRDQQRSGRTWRARSIDRPEPTGRHRRLPGRPNVGAATLATATGPAGACNLVGQHGHLPGGLADGGQEVLTFTQTVDVGAVGGAVIANTASVTDPTTGDNDDSSTDQTTVGVPGLSLAKSATARHVRGGRRRHRLQLRRDQHRRHRARRPVTVSDDQATVTLPGDRSLAPAATITCTASSRSPRPISTLAP